jgi:aminopeptidase N
LHGNGTIKSSLRGSSLSKDYGYGSFKLEVINNNHLGKLDLKTRFYFQHIEGNAIPEEVLLNLASANMEDLLESKFTRSRAWIPPSNLGYGVNTNHFQMGGGLNLRGYAGYLAPVNANGNQYNLFQGNGGVSGSVELDFDRLVKWQPKLTKQYLHIDAYAFADAGLIYQTTNQTVVQSPLRMDAGIGMAASIYKWGKRNLIQPFTIRLDAPVFLNTPPFVASGYIQNRWVIGIGRSF